MEEFEAAWNIVGITVSWLVGGLLLIVIVGIATAIWNEYM